MAEFNLASLILITNTLHFKLPIVLIGVKVKCVEQIQICYAKMYYVLDEAFLGINSNR